MYTAAHRINRIITSWLLSLAVDARSHHLDLDFMDAVNKCQNVACPQGAAQAHTAIAKLTHTHPTARTTRVYPASSRTRTRASQESITPDTMAARADRLAGALWGLYAGDAIAMPVHWYYDVG